MMSEAGSRRGPKLRRYAAIAALLGLLLLVLLPVLHPAGGHGGVPLLALMPVLLYGLVTMVSAAWVPGFPQLRFQGHAPLRTTLFQLPPPRQG